ncbi:MAG: hypothetical protein AAF296_05385 [Pseudomonadota bacterium]
MDASLFAQKVGPTLLHFTLAENLPSIERNGLLRPITLARICDVPIEHLMLRTEALQLHSAEVSARLNSQAWLVAGRRQADHFLDGHSLEGWSRQLDERLFFWPYRKGAAFAKSLTDRGDFAMLEMDSRRFYEALRDQIDLSPINSGSAMRKPARRGNWIYVSAKADWVEFAENRIRRGLTASRDTVVEVSLKSDISPVLLKDLRIENAR